MKRKSTSAIVVHCSATKPDHDIGAAEIREWHLSRGWSDIGYHFVVRRNGRIELGRAIDEVGAHVAGRNADTVAICLVGGLDAEGKSVDRAEFTFTQIESARQLIRTLLLIYPDADVVGHRDLSPDKNGDGKIEKWEWVKTCPGLDVGQVFADLT